MHRQVDAVLIQGLFELTDEKALAADLSERGRGHLVTAGADRHDFDRQIGKQVREGSLDQFRLRERERAGSRSDTQCCRHLPYTRRAIRQLQSAAIASRRSFDTARRARRLRMTRKTGASQTLVVAIDNVE